MSSNTSAGRVKAAQVEVHKRSADDLVAHAADAMLHQCSAFVESLPDHAYAVDSKTLKGGTCGKHVRHILDHFSAIFTGLDTSEPIMYDRRERNVPMESSRSAALATIAELRGRLVKTKRPLLSASVRVRVMLAGDGTEAELSSTLGRELAFATHHAVHHHAMLKAIASEFGVDTGSDFGKAPSTINFEHSSGQSH
jgi:Mg2+ and Co2+ transporter CorA